MITQQPLQFNSENPCEVFIVDDHPSVSTGLATFLSNYSEFKVTHTFISAAELYDKLHYQQAHLIICDIGLEQINGIEICKEVKEKYPHIKLVFYTFYTRIDVVSTALKAKPDGYLLKEMTANELYQGLLHVFHKGNFIHPLVASLINNKKFTGIEITEREKDVLLLLAKGKTSNEIAEILFISPHTVESHRKNLIAKTQVKNIAELIHWAHKEGILSAL